MAVARGFTSGFIAIVILYCSVFAHSRHAYNTNGGGNGGKVVSDQYHHFSSHGPGAPVNPKCEPISIPLCQDIEYNMTIFPNLLNHQKQEEAGLEVHQFFPLVKVKCSPDLKFFLCTMYAPVCTVLDDPIPPCRFLCKSARDGCEILMNKFGFNWPKSLECDEFPESGLCVGENKTQSSAGSTNDGGNGGMFGGLETDDQRPEPAYPGPGPVGKTPDPKNNTHCPEQLTTRDSGDGSDYKIRVHGKPLRCGLPCEAGKLFFDSKEVQIIRIWTGVWAILCAVSTLFTVLTFFIDMDRFRYPERPIIFLSFCYLFIAVAHAVGFAMPMEISCYLRSQTGLQLISRGTGNQLCTALAMTIYFFTMASSIWWVALTVTWFLTAGLKWGHEAIEAHAYYFHIAAWGIPAILMIAVLVTHSIDGDVFSGVCSVGNLDPDKLR